MHKALRLLGGGSRALQWLRFHAEIPYGIKNIFHFPIRGIMVRLLRKTVGYVRSKPRLKRLVLSLVSGMPGLGIKLRKIYMASQSELVPNWDVGEGGSSMPVSIDHAGTLYKQTMNYPIFLHSLSLLEGVNEQQRTPLEANFHMYAGDE